MIGEFNCYFHSGGGFLLSKECLHLIYAKLWNMFLEWSKICNKSACEYLICACDVAISFFLQNTIGSELKILTFSDEFISCNYKGLAYNNTFLCCGDRIKPQNIISCHCMTIGDFDEFTEILERNNYFY
jgi:hypothetical protein